VDDDEGGAGDRGGVEAESLSYCADERGLAGAERAIDEDDIAGAEDAAEGFADEARFGVGF
jgi:hypothetical protein